MSDEALFCVIDTETGGEADVEEIPLKEEWAKGLVYCDMEGFMIGEYGQLVLADECGRFHYCPEDRFKVVWKNQPTISEWILKIDGKPESGGTIGLYECSNCHKKAYATEFPRYFEDEKGRWHDPHYCPWCGSKNSASEMKGVEE